MSRVNCQARTPPDDDDDDELLSRAQINFDRVYNGVRGREGWKERAGAYSRLIVSIKIMRKEQLFCPLWVISLTSRSRV